VKEIEAEAEANQAEILNQARQRVASRACSKTTGAEDQQQ